VTWRVKNEAVQALQKQSKGVICAEVETDHTKLFTGSGAAGIFCPKVAPVSSAEHCGKPLVRTYWANMTRTGEGGKGSRKSYQEDTAFWCLRGGELSM